MAAGEIGRTREGETAEENETTNVKRRKLEEVETRMFLSRCVQETNRGGIVSDGSETNVLIVTREKQCHQIPSSECDLLSSSSVSCCSSNNRTDHDRGEFDICENFNKRDDPEEEELVKVDPAAVEMEGVESCGIKKQRKRCETVKEAELKDFFQAAEKDVRNKMLKCSSKYNFDFEKDEPLDGRYKWQKFNS